MVDLWLGNFLFESLSKSTLSFDTKYQRTTIKDDETTVKDENKSYIRNYYTKNINQRQENVKKKFEVKGQQHTF